jgi:hypothetical protein
MHDIGKNKISHLVPFTRIDMEMVNSPLMETVDFSPALKLII